MGYGDGYFAEPVNEDPWSSSVNENFSYTREERLRDMARRARKANVNIPQEPQEITSMGALVPVTSKDAALEQLTAALQNFAGITALLNRFNGQEPPKGTVLQWKKSYRSGGEREMVLQLDEEAVSSRQMLRELRFKASAPQEYAYVAFRADDGNWYVTGSRGANVRTWDNLVKEIGDSPAWLASEWTEVPAPEKLADEALDPTEWAKLMFGKKEQKTDVTKTTEES